MLTGELPMGRFPPPSRKVEVDVRLDEVVQIKVRKGSRYAAVLASGEEIPMGRTRVDAIRARLVLL